MQAQTTKKERTTKARNSGGVQDVGVARLVPPTADALREAHVNLVRAEQNLYTLMQANPASGALFGSQPSFGHSAAFAPQQTGYQAPGFDAGFAARPGAFQGFPGAGNAMVPSLSAMGANPSGAISPWGAWTGAHTAAPYTAPIPSWADRAFAPLAQGHGSIGRASLACDIIDEGEQLICQLELPGIEADQVEVLCFGNAVTVNVFREPEGEILNIVQAERATSPQQRILRLPSQIQPSGATAALTNGVLTIVLPKLNPTEGPRLVKIQS
jgi:HSP20 family protein